MRKNFAVLGLAAWAVAAPVLADPAVDALARRLDELGQQIDALKTQVRELKSQNEALANQLEGSAHVAAAPAAEPSASAQPASATPTPVVATLPSVLDRASLFGYGEIAYNHYDHAPENTQADLRRAVFGIGYRFDEKTRFVSEFEVEHAIASADDRGEFEVEQFYIDHRLASFANVKVGLILIPSGYLNQTHEPPRYYGVERNFVETAIIPSTWREGGVGLYGDVLHGLSWDLGVTTGPSIAKWDFASGDGRESPLGAIHQELQLANASDLAQYAALNYNGLPGFNVGASVFTGKIGQSQPGIPGHPRATLWEAHTRWTPGRFDLSALYAKGTISDTAALNRANLGQPTPIPDAFHGWYLQAAYKLWERDKHSIAPFLRYERFNVADGYAAQPMGLGVNGLPTETVRTYGANFYLNPNVVFKADYQQFQVNKDSNRFDLGLGFMFY